MFDDALQVVEARRRSRCGLCDNWVDEGDPIVCVDDQWVHAECAESEGEAVDW